ncbi:MAG: M28 family peptidase [Solirubrobacteraceae bacterium]
MRLTETVSGLVGVKRRGPGTDAERRASIWLGDELARAGRDVRIEPFWCRPNTALAHTWHVALAIAGSLIAIPSHTVGAVLVAIALVSIVADATIGLSLGRRLTLEHASQNVIATSPNGPAHPVRLIITANYDAGRAALAYRDAFRATSARLRRLVGNRAPGWLAWLTIATAWLLATAIMRIAGVSKTTVGAVQLIPTVGLVIAVPLLLDMAGADWSPGANDNASGVAVAMSLATALDAAPPPGVAVDLVLTGAGEGGGIGLRKYLRANRRTLQPSNAIVVGIAPTGGGRPRWWVGDGQFVPFRTSGTLRTVAAETAAGEPHLKAAPHRGRGATPALPALKRRLPAIAIGCLDDRSLAPYSHQAGDTEDNVDPKSLDDALQFALMLVDAIGEYAENNPVSQPRASTPA